MYRIELREYPVLHFAAHAFWAFYDSGELVGELHGLATDRRTHTARAFGTCRDQLRGWMFPAPGQAARAESARGGLSGLYRPTQAREVVFETASDEAQERWLAGLLAAQALSDANIEYRLFGGESDDITTGNSNSACRTFADVMGLRMPVLKAWARPGEHKNLLPRETYAGLYEAGYACS